MDDEKGNEPVHDRQRPIPIRDVLGEVASGSGGRSDPSGGSLVPASGIRDKKDQSKTSKGSRVSKNRIRKGRSRRDPNGRSGSRAKTKAVRESVERRPLHPTSIESLPSRNFESEGSGWIVRLSGQGSVGFRGDRGAQLLHLTFFRAVDPSVAVWESLALGKSMEDFSDEQLYELLVLAKSVD